MACYTSRAVLSAFPRLATLASVLALTLASSVAAAAPSEAELAGARDLFTAASRDEDAGRWAAALEKLHQVAGVRLTAGVRYHMALCEENLGHLAPALEGFTAAQAQAQADGAQDVLKLVSRRIALLNPRVPRLVVRVLPPVPGAVVKLDGVPLATAQLEAQIPMDPGVHYLEATAEHHALTKASVALVERDSKTVDLSIPDLPESSAGAAATTPTPPPSTAPTPTPTPTLALTPTPTPTPTLAPPPSSHTAAVLFSLSSLAVAGGGVAAYLLAGSALSSGTADCGAELTTAPCTSEKNAVRAWDFTAASAWVAAAALGVTAVVLWAQSGGGASGALVVRPGAAGVEGRF